MRLTEDNILVDGYLVDECISELESIDDREKFYNEQVYSRLEKCVNLYVSEFNESVDKFINKVDTSNCSINKIGRILKSISKFTCSLYELEIKLYDSIWK